MWPLPNVWLGVSIEDQAAADVRIPILLETPAAIRWISAEPMLGPIDLRLRMTSTGAHIVALSSQVRADNNGKHGLDWVVAGGESGPGARPIHLDWARSLRDQCQAAGVPFLFKQWGEWIDADSWLDEIEAGPTKLLSHGKPCRPSRPLNYSDAATLADICSVRRTEQHSDGRTLFRVGKKRAGRTLDGRIHNAWPEAPAP